RGRNHSDRLAASDTVHRVPRGPGQRAGTTRVAALGVVLRSTRGRRRLRAAASCARVGDLPVKVLAYVPERYLQSPRRGGDGVVDALVAGGSRFGRERALDERGKLRGDQYPDAARRRDVVLDDAKRQPDAGELRGGAVLSQGGAAVGRPLVFHELGARNWELGSGGSPPSKLPTPHSQLLATFSTLCRAV